MTTTKTTITTNAILNANNVKTFTNKWNSIDIVTNVVEIPVDAIVNIEGSEEDVEYIMSKATQYQTKEGEQVNSIKLPLSDTLTIHDKMGNEIDLEGNISDHIGLAKINVARFDTAYANKGTRVNSIVFNVNGADEVEQYKFESDVKAGQAQF